MTNQSPVLILGGSSLITRYLLPRLREDGRPAFVAARTELVLPGGCAFIPFDDLRASRWRLPDGCCVASLLPLPALVPLLGTVLQARRIVALGSTSLFSKASSAEAAERAAALALREAEMALDRWSQIHDVPSTVLRPTLVYDGVGDKNIARMAGFIQRWRMLPLARPARGLRQPIHAEDVATAILRAFEGDAPHRAFNIAGAERLTYKAMAERVFQSLGLAPRFVMLPTSLLRFAFAAASRVGLVQETAFGGSVFQRMNQDLVYDVAPGLAALRYEPRRFDPRPDRV